MTCRLILVLFLSAGLLLVIGCKSHDEGIYVIQRSATSTKGMVVSSHPLATEVGVEILRKGGNAADAAIAVQFALAVVYPRAGNIGGGGFLNYRDRNGNVYTLDYREKAPLASHRDMFLDTSGKIVPMLSREGALAVGVPGSVAGMVETHKRFGKLRWHALLEPATRLALRGFRITEQEAKRLNEYREVFIKYNGEDIPFVSREEWTAGDLLVQRDLAATLQLIANHGHQGFYSGDNAKFLLAAMQKHGGLITQEDLTSYAAVWRDPIRFQWNDLSIYAPPLPSSGGIMLKQLFGMIDDRLADSLSPGHPYNVHIITEAERRSFADRANFLGDPEFYHVPVDSITSKQYLQNRFADFDSLHASMSGTPDSALFHFAKDRYETTHLSIVDNEGNAASVTTTLNDNYGSKVWVERGGYFLNDEMDDFSAKPGEPNLFGLIGAAANEVSPNKRMLSSMTPTIVEKSGNLYMVLGSPGGSVIMTSIMQVILNHTFYGLPIEESVQRPRYHHQWLPDEIIYEEGAFSENDLIALDSLGHTLRKVELIGEVNTIVVEPDKVYHGIADRRREAHAKGL